jgi:nitrile hydratase
MEKAMTSHERDHDHTKRPSGLELKAKALASLLVERQIVEATALDAIVDRLSMKRTPLIPT